MRAEVNSRRHDVVTTRQLLGTWDLVASHDRDRRRFAARPDVLGLMTCSPDGTFTLQMKRADGTTLSTWGHFHLFAPHGLVHVVEWHTDTDRIGTSRTFDVWLHDEDRLELVADDGTALVFDR